MTGWGDKWPNTEIKDGQIKSWPEVQPTFIGVDLASKPDKTTYDLVYGGRRQGKTLNKIPTHDPYTNPGAFIYYECECGEILDPKTKSFAELNNQASKFDWKIRWGQEYYVPYCPKCAKLKGIE